MMAFQMRSVAIGWHVYAVTSSPLDLGLVGLSQFVPMLILSPFAGQLVDRVDRKKVLLWTLTIDAGLSLTLFWLANSPQLPVTLIYGCLMVAGAARPFAATAGQSLLPSLVPVVKFPKAVAWNATTWQIAGVLGPTVGGVLYASFGAPSVYLICAVLTVFALLFISRVTPGTQRYDRNPVSLNSYLSGIRFILEKRIILGAISLDLFAVLLGGAMALLPIYAKDILHAGPTGLGFLRAAPGIGAAITGLLLARFPVKKNTGSVMLVCVALFGVFTVAFGLSTHFILSTVCLFLMGAVDLVSVVIRSMMIQLMTPDEMRGRVSAVNHVFIGTSNELGEFESGVTAAWLGTVPAVVLGGLGTLVVVSLWTWRFPEFRRFDSIEATSA